MVERRFVRHLKMLFVKSGVQCSFLRIVKCLVIDLRYGNGYQTSNALLQPKAPALRRNLRTWSFPAQTTNHTALRSWDAKLQGHFKTPSGARTPSGMMFQKATYFLPTFYSTFHLSLSLDAHWYFSTQLPLPHRSYSRRPPHLTLSTRGARACKPQSAKAVLCRSFSAFAMRFRVGYAGG